MKKTFKIVGCFGLKERKGKIVYDDEKKSAQVSYPTAEGKKAVVKFLNTKRTIRILSRPIDGLAVMGDIVDEDVLIGPLDVLARPVDSMDYMEHALTEMASAIGIGLWRVNLTEFRRE